MFLHCWFHLQKPRDQKWTFIVLLNPLISCQGFDTIVVQVRRKLLAQSLYSLPRVNSLAALNMSSLNPKFFAQDIYDA